MSTFFVVIALGVAPPLSSMDTPLLPAHEPSLAKVLPIELSSFFSTFFNRKMVRLNHTDTSLDPSLLWSSDELDSTLTAMASDGKLSRGTNAVALHGNKSGFEFKTENETVQEVTERFIHSLRNHGVSYVLKFEYVSAAFRPLKWLSDVLFDVGGIPASIHLYCSSPGAQVLKPHTDPYDVIVWQLVGVKRWKACVPRVEIASATTSAQDGDTLTDAQRCLLQELAKDNIDGCTSYSVDDTHALVCEECARPRPMHPSLRIRADAESRPLISRPLSLLSLAGSRWRRAMCCTCQKESYITHRPRPAARRTT